MSESFSTDGESIRLIVTVQGVTSVLVGNAANYPETELYEAGKK